MLPAVTVHAMQGDTFGAKALASLKMHLDDCLVLEESTFIAIPKRMFNEYIKPEMAAWVKPVTTFLSQSAALDGCIPDDYFSLTLAMVQKRYQKGEHIVSTKRPGASSLMLVRYGSCSLVRHCKVMLNMMDVELAKLVPGDAILGEMLVNSPSDLRIVADSSLVLYNIAMPELQHCAGWGNLKINLAQYCKRRRTAWDERTIESVSVLENSQLSSSLPSSLQQVSKPAVEVKSVTSPRHPQAYSSRRSPSKQRSPSQPQDSPTDLSCFKKSAQNKIALLQPTRGGLSHLGFSIHDSMHGSPNGKSLQPAAPLTISELQAKNRNDQREVYVEKHKQSLLVLPPLSNTALHTPRSFKPTTNVAPRSSSVPPPCSYRQMDTPKGDTRWEGSSVPRCTLLSRQAMGKCRKWRDTPGRVTGQLPCAGGVRLDCDKDWGARQAAKKYAATTRVGFSSGAAVGSSTLEPAGTRVVFTTDLRVPVPGDPRVNRVHIETVHNRRVVTPEYTGREAKRCCAFHGHINKVVRGFKEDTKATGPATFLDKAVEADKATGQSEARARDPLCKTHSPTALALFSNLGTRRCTRRSSLSLSKGC